MKLSEHEVEVIFRKYRLWEYVSKELKKFILDSIGNDPCIAPNVIKSINESDRNDYITIEWNLGSHAESVYLYIQATEETYEVTGHPKTDTCNVVQVQCQLNWASTSRNVVAAQAAMLLYQKAINLATLVQGRYSVNYGFSKTF